RLHVELDGGPPDPVAEGVEVEGEDVPETVDPGLHQELMVVRAEAREVEHQRLVPPREDLVRVGADLVGKCLAASHRLTDLEEEASGEDPVVLEAVEMDLLDPGQLSDRWHGLWGPQV